MNRRTFPTGNQAVLGLALFTLVAATAVPLTAQEVVRMVVCEQFSATW